ncbi:ThuA domain-containing protein [Aurantibacter crassamenti]|uniref:ThuA domain-containing protein n=1 Tax=Aurantibacter crassamenti TaxID=1837375 RepID=UPI00193A69ED|nr:ThuA domain-containing protein [Aurantibacter crassamenti]MBM1105362.1 ThuA domain-containing protein [Aurantibacter crassamenti]
MFPLKHFLVLFVVLFSTIGCQKDNDLLLITESVLEKANIGKIDSLDVSVAIDSILVFHKTTGFRHSSIEKGIETIESIALDNNLVIENTEDNSLFTASNLNKYGLVIFLNTTGDVLNDVQQEVFENYIQAGGSFMGIHAATDTEFEWPWYGQLVGAYFLDHPEVQQATIALKDLTHVATNHLNTSWMVTDEWYNFKDFNSNINVLLNLDESTYSGGSNGTNHPIAWYHEFDGGRSFYTGLGHEEAVYDLSEFRTHLLGGITYCLGRE